MLQQLDRLGLLMTSDSCVEQIGEKVKLSFSGECTSEEAYGTPAQTVDEMHTLHGRLFFDLIILINTVAVHPYVRAANIVDEAQDTISDMVTASTLDVARWPVTAWDKIATGGGTFIHRRVPGVGDGYIVVGRIRAGEAIQSAAG